MYGGPLLCFSTSTGNLVAHSHAQQYEKRSKKVQNVLSDSRCTKDKHTAQLIVQKNDPFTQECGKVESAPCSRPHREAALRLRRFKMFFKSRRGCSNGGAWPCFCCLSHYAGLGFAVQLANTSGFRSRSQFNNNASYSIRLRECVEKT